MAPQHGTDKHPLPCQAHHERPGVSELPVTQICIQKHSGSCVILRGRSSRQFSVNALHQAWCTDKAYIKIGHQWSHLAAVKHLFAKKPIGWALSGTPGSHSVSMSFQPNLWLL